MDIWGALVFFFIVFLIMSCCGYCCTTKKRGAVLSTPVVVTSATHTTNDYTVTQMPVPVAGYQTNLYATTYPTQMGAPGHVQVQMPMPMPMHGAPPPAGYQPPYPPMHPVAPGNMNPPPYDIAMSSAGAGPNNTGYEKQAPYNPSFTAH